MAIADAGVSNFGWTSPNRAKNNRYRVCVKWIRGSQRSECNRRSHAVRRGNLKDRKNVEKRGVRQQVKQCDERHAQTKGQRDAPTWVAR